MYRPLAHDRKHGGGPALPLIGLLLMTMGPLGALAQPPAEISAQALPQASVQMSAHGSVQGSAQAPSQTITPPSYIDPALERAPDRAACERNFTPRSGQPGKDVIWVPTSDQLVTRMLKLASVSPQDLVYDLGAGDGKIAIAAAREFGARAVGVEYNPEMARLAQCYAEAEGVADRVRIIHGDIFETDFSSASVVTLYLLPELNLRLRPTILKMKPGTRIVSHSFMMDDWEPDDRSVTQDGQAYMWIVPADVAGTWLFQRKDGRERFEIHLEQTFQYIKGTVGRRSSALREASLSGDRLQLAFGERMKFTRISGQVRGERIEAKLTRRGSTFDYTATRHARN